jgi:hypothetical protein
MKRKTWIFAALGLFLFAQSALADWTPAKRISWTDGHSYTPAVAVDSGGATHVVWFDDTAGDYEIYYRKSEDGGTTWSWTQRLTWTTGESRHPAVAIDSSGTVHVVWDDDTPGDGEIYYRKSEDGGTTWSAVSRLTWNSGGSLDPVIAIDSADHIQIVWRDTAPGSSQVYYRGSKDGGSTWSWNKRISWTPGWSFMPAIAVDSADTIHVVWYNNAPDNSEIYYRKSGDGGANWSVAKRLTWTPGDSIYPAIAADNGGNIHVVWYDDTPGNQEIYYRGSDNGGDSWSPAKRMTWLDSNSRSPSVTVNSTGDVYVIWEDWSVELSDIFYKSSTDGGATWTAATRLTWTERYSKSPAVAASGGDIRVVWYDDTPGNYEIYYKSGH